ncbi:MAG: hypothetical protein CMF23_08855 [Ignavibacteriae bacterium]|nr:hypothetical protein [Ignavibacteriota bacterium]
MSTKDIVQLTLENSEILIDQLNENNILKDIPFVGNAFKIASIANDVRGRLFIAKLAKFILSLDQIPSEDKSKMINKLKSDPNESNRIASKLIFVIDRITDVDKSEIIANIFIAYIKEQLNSEDLCRILDSLDRAYIKDIQKLLCLTKLDDRFEESSLSNLLSTGFIHFFVGNKWEELSQNYYELSSIGRLFINANSYGLKLRKSS